MTMDEYILIPVSDSYREFDVAVNCNMINVAVKPNALAGSPGTVRAFDMDAQQSITIIVDQYDWVLTKTA